MIKTDEEYQNSLISVSESDSLIYSLRNAYLDEGYTIEEASNLCTASLTYVKMIKEDIRYYEMLKNKEFVPHPSYYDSYGHYLIAKRIYLGLSQEDLAARLNITTKELAKMEYNDYHGQDTTSIEAVLNNDS